MNIKDFFSLTSLPALLLTGLLCMAPGCDVEQTEQGELPDMNVDVEGDPGEMPEYDVETPEVDVTTEEQTVEVPDVDVETETETVEVPDVNVDLPDEQQ
jgi:hypothetical protein